MNFRKARIGKSLQNLAFITFMVFVCMIFCSCAAKSRDLRTLDQKNPLKKSQVLELSLKSRFMGRKMPLMIYLPKGYGSGRLYPVWYGLHGHSKSETMWTDGGVAKAADELIAHDEIEPIIMVFPFTQDSTLEELTKDLKDDGKFSERNMDQFICKELIPYIDSHYYTKPSADSRYIGGLSMGGMIALRIAFHHPDMFRKVGGYTAAVLSNDYSDRQLEKWLYPNDDIDQLVDLSKFDKQKEFRKLNVYLDAGNNNDPFLDRLRSLYKALKKRKIKSEFHVYNGGHAFQTDNIKDYLRFYASKG